ncbi:MAG: GFA family protein [Cyanobacteria bacterium P01_H01_bin.21]
MSDGFKGRCLCGAVRFESTANPQLVGHCHCLDCRKLSGTGHCTNIMIPEDAFTITGEVKFYESFADSGNLVSRGFCPNCGSAIYSTNSGMPGVVYPRASSLDDPNILEPQVVVYASRALTWDPVNPALIGFPEMPPSNSDKEISVASTSET